MTRLPGDRDVELAVRTWMRDEDERPADRNRQVGRIMGRIDETRQRRRAWQLLPFRPGRASADEADDDLVRARRDAPSLLLAAAAVIALVATGLAFLALTPSEPSTAPAALPSPSASPAPLPTIDPADQALRARLGAIWSGEPAALGEVAEVYAEDAVNTVLWLDRVERIEGQDALWARIQASSSDELGDWTRAQDAANGDHRYLGASANLGGVACVFWVRDARIRRQDCIVPLTQVNGTPFTPGEPPSDVSRETLQELIAAAWAHDREAFDSVVAPDIVHHVAFNDHAVTHTDSETYWQVANTPGMPPPTILAPTIDLPAPEGELRWSDFSDVGGGSLCTFWTRGRQLIRHDCIVPTFTTINPTPAPASPTPASPTPAPSPA